jgi:hypothetical protein
MEGYILYNATLFKIYSFQLKFKQIESYILSFNQTSAIVKSFHLFLTHSPHLVLGLCAALASWLLSA